MTPSYVELHARSAFSFLRAASQPEALAETAAQLDLPALAVCDRDGVYGAARFYARAREHGVKPIVGAELMLDDGSVLPVLVASRTGYQNLCRLITRAKLRGSKHHAPVRWEELAEFTAGVVALTGDEEGPVRRALENDDHAGALACVEKLTAVFGTANVFVEIQRHLRRGEDLLNDRLLSLADSTGLPALATNGVLHATRDERAVLDVFTCAREHTHLDAAGRSLAFNDERHLKPARMMQRLFADRPDALANTVRLAERLDFTLEDLGYEFPRYQGMQREEMDAFLRKMTMAGARSRYSHLSRRVLDQLNRELKLIAQLGFSGYFLIVWDIVNFCTEQNILVQGRGSAAIGVASNKFLAKLGSDFQKPDGLTLIRDRDKVGFLRPLSVRSIHGVGPVTAQALEAKGFVTIGDLQTNSADLSSVVGSFAESLRARAFGNDERPVDTTDERKSISAENTFLQDTDDRPTLRAALKEMATDVAQTLEKHEVGALTIQVKVRYSDFTTLTRQVRLEEPVVKAVEIYRLAQFLLARDRLVTSPLRLIGIGVSTLVSPTRHQLLLPI